MFQTIGTGVAVGNAHPSVKEIAGKEPSERGNDHRDACKKKKKRRNVFSTASSLKEKIDIWVYFKSFTLIFKTSLILPPFFRPHNREQ